MRTTTAANTHRGSTAAGLKVRSKWVRKMRNGSKNCEVRGYTPNTHIKWRSPVQVGERFLILCNGFIQGSVLLSAVERYASRQQFLADTASHQVTEASAGAQMLADCASKADRGLYAWRLQDFRWFPKCERPESGKFYCGQTMPEFRGQEYGQVWCTVGFPEALLFEGSPAGEALPSRV